jgi:putative salt-induced outer membrane protein YdiY
MTPWSHERHRTSAIRCAVIAAILLGFGTDPAAAQAKTDVIELRNGDRITCEIRKLERGKLTVKTDGIGTIAIEWDDVERVTSKASYDIELMTGARVFGSLERGDADMVVVSTSSGPERLTLATIVRISPVGGTIWGRMDGSVDAGFSFTQANVQTQWSFNADVSYRSRRWLSTLSADSLLTELEDSEGQVRNTLALQTQRFLTGRWSALGFAQFQQNEELSLDLRSVIGAGAVRILAQSNRTVLAVVGGVAMTNERYTGVDSEMVAEAVAGMTWEWFTFDGRSTTLNNSVLSFSAMNRARVRLEINSSFKSDIVGDLYWSINAFESYNSEPPPDEKSSDFGVSATVGWSF